MSIFVGKNEPITSYNVIALSLEGRLWSKFLKPYGYQPMFVCYSNVNGTYATHLVQDVHKFFHCCRVNKEVRLCIIWQRKKVCECYISPCVAWRFFIHLITSYLVLLALFMDIKYNNTLKLWKNNQKSNK